MGIVRIMHREVTDAFASRPAMQLVALLLLLDAMFIAAHLLYLSSNGVGFFRRWRFSMDFERSYSEWYEFLKTAVCTLALIGCYRRSAQPVYRGLAIVFGLILADNALNFHEHIGLWLSLWLGMTKPLFEHAPSAFGEFAYLVTLGMVSLTILFVTLRRSGPEHQVRGALFVILILGLGGFGAGLDLAHTASLSVNLDLSAVIGTVEECGELLILSAACALAVALFWGMAASRPAGGDGEPTATRPATVKGAV